MSVRARLEHWLTHTPLRQQLQVTASVIALVVGTISLTVLIMGGYLSARETLRNELRVQTQIIAANSSAAAAFADEAVAAEVLAAMKSSPDVMQVKLQLSGGRMLAQYQATDQAGGPAKASSIWSEAVVLTEPVAYRGETFGQLILTGDFSRLNRGLFLYFSAATVAMFLAVAALHYAFKLSMAFLMQPISQLTGLMRRVTSEGNYQLRSGIAVHNEIGDIARNFDQMLQQIEQRDSVLAQELEERRRTEAKLEHLVRHDTLTGLYNRHAFLQAMAEMERESGARLQLGLLLLDVDHFKLVNDSLGHHAGDRLLIEIATRLRSLQSNDVDVFRLGGDEFAVLMRGNNGPESARQLADSITAAMNAPFSILSQELFTSLSVGIALCPEHATEMEPLLNCADLALYEAKGLGRDRWALFTPALKAGLDRRLRLETELHRALERDELFLMYEPQIALTDGRLVGVEALVRWQHPEHGVMNPADFIPMSEEGSLIIKLGEWVLRRACADGLAIRRAKGGQDLRLAVNLSPRQLADAAVTVTVSRVLNETGFPPAALELEVTESVMIEKLDLVTERMNAIAALGVSFALDDFGVGASSLSYLRRLPLSKIKIDRSFVRELPQNEDDAAVAAAITTLGHRLGIPVLAEGVETPAQLDCLRSLGCTLGQGFLFAQPARLESFIARMNDDGHTATFAQCSNQG